MDRLKTVAKWAAVGSISVAAVACPPIYIGILAGLSVRVYSQLTKRPAQLPVGVRNADHAEELVEQARKLLGIDVKNNYNFAIVGQSGAGKSTLVNALCGWNEESAQARVGESETTQTTAKYHHPVFPNVVLWDIPGAGTDKHPANTYFKDKGLYAFDSIVLVTHTRFTEIDMNIAKEAVTRNIPVFFVRSKVSTDLEARRRRKGNKGISHEQLVESYRAELENEFNPKMLALGVGSQVLYLVDAWALTDDERKPQDEAKLLKTLYTNAATLRASCAVVEPDIENNAAAAVATRTNEDNAATEGNAATEDNAATAVATHPNEDNATTAATHNSEYSAGSLDEVLNNVSL